MPGCPSNIPHYYSSLLSYIRPFVSSSILVSCFQLTAYTRLEGLASRLGETYCLSFTAEDGGSIFLREAVVYLLVCTASQPKRPTWYLHHPENLKPQIGLFRLRPNWDRSTARSSGDRPRVEVSNCLVWGVFTSKHSQTPKLFHDTPRNEGRGWFWTERNCWKATLVMMIVLMMQLVKNLRDVSQFPPNYKKTKMTVLWVTAPCSMVEVAQTLQRNLFPPSSGRCVTYRPDHGR